MAWRVESTTLRDVYAKVVAVVDIMAGVGDKEVGQKNNDEEKFRKICKTIEFNEALKSRSPCEVHQCLKLSQCSLMFYQKYCF